MSERYQNCPVCGSLCTIGGDKKEGTHYYVPVSGNAEFAAAPAAKPIEAELRRLKCDCCATGYDDEIGLACDNCHDGSLYSPKDASYQQVQVSTTYGTCEAQFTVEEIELMLEIILDLIGSDEYNWSLERALLAKCDAILKGAGDEG